MTDPRAVSTCTEDYLEAILRLIAEKGAARVRDIANALSVHKSTVSWTLKNLAGKGLVNYSRYEITTLTTLGEKVAKDVVRRHEILRDFFVRVLALEGEVADANACRAEHILDAEVLERLAGFARFVSECPNARQHCLKNFQTYYNRRTKQASRVRLDQLKCGQKGTIARVGGAGPLRRRIADMGVVRGTPVEVVKVAPLGDPMELKVKGYHLSLRKEEAAVIDVEV
jgi:DtxR family Mn-dependent transcriptional regulator